MGFGRQLVAADAYPASPLGRSVTRGFAVELYLDTALENQILRAIPVAKAGEFHRLVDYCLEGRPCLHNPIFSSSPPPSQAILVAKAGEFRGLAIPAVICLVSNPKDQPSMADVAKWLTSWVGHHKPSA
ncbi:unnamed protein product [Closterium sp. NIES-64]|nr:unnamed protein product [Closterium sp. NIES-64]